MSTNISKEVFDKLGYLNLLQSNIARMAGNSAIMKGFAATILASFFALNFSNICWFHICLSIIPIISFVIMDIYYLQLERKYRNLYNLVAEGNIPVHKYYLDINNTFFDDYRKKINEGTGFFKCLFSKSICLFYSWFLLFILFVAFTKVQ